jgi:hypothetical protein
MASTYTPLGVELMATGENAGTWGTKTNTNLNIVEQISGGYIAKSITGGAQTTALSVSDGSTGAELAHRMIEFTGSISGNQIVTIPLDVQNFYFLRNSTSGAYTVQFKYASGSGDTFTFSATDKGDQIIFATANDGTNPDIDTLAIGTGDVTLTGTQTLTNKTLTDPILSPGTATGGKVEFLEGTDNGTNKVTLIGPASTADVTVTLPAATDTLVGKATTDTLTNKTLTAPKIGTSILDTNGNELFLLTATGSAVNELTYANAATGNKPTLTATGDDTNIGVSIQPKGSGTITIDALTFPAADGSADQILTTNGSGVLSFVDNSGGTSWQAVKTSGFTAVAGEGYFINTTSGAIEMDLPAGSLGAEVSFIDYAGTFDSNALTIDPNGSEKIAGSTDSLTVSVERAANTLVYVDSTQGWLLKNN